MTFDGGLASSITAPRSVGPPQDQRQLAGASARVVGTVGGEGADGDVAAAVAVEVAGEELLAVGVGAIDAVDDRRIDGGGVARSIDAGRSPRCPEDDVRLADVAAEVDRIADVVRAVAAARAVAVELAGRVDLRRESVEAGADQDLGGAVAIEVGAAHGSAAVIAADRCR